MTYHSEIDPPSQDAMDELLARFLRDDLTLAETEQAIRELRREGQDVVSPLLAMLDDPRPERHTIASVLLAATGDPSTIPALVERIHDPALDDIIKIKLITVLMHLDPHLDAAGLLAHLTDAQQAVRQTRQEHLELLESPGDVAMWMENVQAEMTPYVRLQLIENSIIVGDPRSVPMLLCLCYDPDDVVALVAIDAVERFKDRRALRPLAELAACHPTEDLRQEAGKALDRLRIRTSLPPASDPLSSASTVGAGRANLDSRTRPSALSPIPPLHAAYLTPVDGKGAQVAFLVRAGPGDDLTAISVLFDDQEGVRHCSGAEFAPGELQEMLNGYGTHGVGPIPVSHAHCLDALDGAVDINWETGHRLPVSFLAWRDWVEHGRASLPAGRPCLAVPLRLRDELLAHCDVLLFQDEFLFWLFPPEEIEDLRSRYLVASGEAGGGVDRETLRCLLGASLRQLITSSRRALIADRLRRMAPLLREVYEEEIVWQWAAVAADALARDSGLPPEEHPFLLGLMAVSLENAIGTPVGWFDEA
jgi:hypothetical protein